MNNLLNGAPLYYPSAIDWMWDYCIYLGPYTDSLGNNFDLGIYMDEYGNISNATVWGNKPGDYSSGVIYPRIDFDDEKVKEVIRRAKELNLIK